MYSSSMRQSRGGPDAKFGPSLMLKSLLRACFGAALALSSPALADAVTYRGTIGSIPIVVEFATEIDHAAGPRFGRYFYESKGVDIPLWLLTVEPSRKMFLE